VLFRALSTIDWQSEHPVLLRARFKNCPRNASQRNALLPLITTGTNTNY
jgi:hypothetical protein